MSRDKPTLIREVEVPNFFLPSLGSFFIFSYRQGNEVWTESVSTKRLVENV